MPLTQQLERRAWRREFLDQGSACPEYGSAQLHESSSTRQPFCHEGAPPYARNMTNSISFGFGERLKAARKAAGITGAELGEGAGENGRNASKASVSDWENERHYPKADQLRVICLKLNISADHLVFGDIKEELRLIQAEATIEMLSPEQRRALLSRMIGGATTNPLAAPYPAQSTDENTRLKDVPRVIPHTATSSHIDTGANKNKYETKAWVIKEKDKTSGQRDTDTPARPERKRKKGSQ